MLPTCLATIPATNAGSGAIWLSMQLCNMMQSYCSWATPFVGIHGRRVEKEARAAGGYCAWCKSTSAAGCDAACITVSLTVHVTRACPQQVVMLLAWHHCKSGCTWWPRVCTAGIPISFAFFELIGKLPSIHKQLLGYTPSQDTRASQPTLCVCLYQTEGQLTQSNPCT